MKSEIVDIDTTHLIRETDKAYQVEDLAGGFTWLPKSLVEYDKRDGVFTMPRWLAEDRGLV